MALTAHKDSLGVFQDHSMYVVNGSVLLDLATKGYPSIKAFAHDAGMTRTRIYKESFKASIELRSRLLDLLRVYNNALKLYDSEKDALDWLFAPNHRFYNLSPFVMAMSGRGNRVYEIQEELLGSASA